MCAHVQCANSTLTKGVCVTSSSALTSIWLDMSLLSVPFVRSSSNPVLSYFSTSATATSFCGSENNPCASARWSGMSGRMANPTQNTGYEPNFYSYLNDQHTPINLSDSFQCRDDATIIWAAEDPEVSCSGASSSSKQKASSMQATCANVEKRICCDHF